MSESVEEVKWRTPYGVSYAKLTKIIRLLLQKKADSSAVPTNSITTIANMSKNFLSTNLSFFKSVGILNGDNDSGYQFTELGTKYAKALSLDNDAEIKKHTLEFVSKSHLNELKIFLETEGDDVTKDKIFKVIKTNAKIKDGTFSGNMPEKTSIGANTLLSIFNKAGLITDQIINKKLVRSDTPKISNPPKKKDKPESDSGSLEPQGKYFSLGSGNFSVKISKEIDLNELEFIQTQISSLTEFAKKRIEENQTE